MTAPPPVPSSSTSVPKPSPAKPQKNRFWKNPIPKAKLKARAQKAQQTPASQNATNFQNVSVSGPSSASGLIPFSLGGKENPSFKLAIQRRLNLLDPVEEAYFRKAYSSIGPQDIIGEVDILNDKHKLGSNVRKADARVATALEVVERFMGGISIAIQAYPDVSCLVLAVRWVTFFLRLTEMLSRFQKTSEVLTVYAKHVGLSDVLMEALADVYGELLDFCAAARSVFVKLHGSYRRSVSCRVFLQSTWADFNTEFGKYGTRLDQHLKLVLQSAQAVQLEMVQEIKEEQDRLHVKETIQDRRALFHWLDPLDFERKHQDLCEKKFKGTGGWLLSKPEFRNWYNDTSSAILWCYGDPGAGKSVLAATVVEQLTLDFGVDDAVGLAFAYCLYDNNRTQDSSRIIASLIHQVCWEKEEVPECLMSFYQRFDNNALKPSLNDYWAVFKQLAQKFEKIYIILDGLDECDPKQRQSLIKLAGEAAGALPNVKIWISSRLDSDIESMIVKGKFPSIKVEAKNSIEDISAFVKDGTKMLFDVRDLRGASETTREEVSKSLILGSNGIFQWVSLQLDCLRREKHEQAVLDALKDLPADLDKTYQRMLELIDSQTGRTRALAYRTLGWVIYAIRPLRMEELRQAVAITWTEDDKIHDWKDVKSEAILESCCNLLSIEDEIVRPIHYSVREFLLAKDSRKIKPIANADTMQLRDPVAVRKMLARTCLYFVQSKLQDSVSCNSELEMLIRHGENPFLWHASCFFDQYLDKAMLKEPVSLIGSLQEFLEQGSDFFSALVQLRVVRDPFGENSSLMDDFVPINEADATTILYTSRLHSMVSVLPNAKQLMMLKTPRFSLHYVARFGDLHAVKRVLLDGHEVDEKDQIGATPLYYASRSGSYDVCELVIEKGASVNVLLQNGSTPLQAAAELGHTPIVNLLLKKGANPDEPASKRAQPLIAASKNGHRNVVDILLQHKANVNSTHDVLGSPLYAGCDNGEIRIVRMLLDHIPKDNTPKVVMDSATPAKFCFPLHVACVNGNDDTVDFLINRGASPLAVGGACEYVLNAACWGCSTFTVHNLISKGALVTAFRGEYGTALEAAVNAGNLETAKLLLEQGAKWDYALIDACRVGDEEIVRHFLEVERKRSTERAANAPDRDEQMRAAMKEFVNVTAVEDDGTSFADLYTPLAAACSSWQHKIVQLLLEHGADPNVKGGGSYEYPLLFALYQMDGDIIRLLLDAGADVVEAGKFSKQLWLEADKQTSSQGMIKDLTEEDKRDLKGAEDPVDHLVVVSRLLGLNEKIGDWISQRRGVVMV
ncbi:hypothetical protein EG327_002547 [Venturia inaequalis]|uniref:Uncharacterized protein n=1 Tax=Venturia inaequalis TaxID=5025 RepID=A0A8H3ZF41_VENIN|nr:hypothetical protein EG327_002547 [Venturia inaequalis]